MINKVVNYIDDNMRGIIKDLIHLVNMPSISSDKKGVVKCLKETLYLGEKYGFKTFHTPEYDVGVIEYGEGEETIGILAHVDVVDIGDRSLWKYPPFEGHFDGEKIFGRGVVDNKGGVIAGLYAMKFLKDLDIYPNKKIQLIIGTQEETVWTDIDNYLKYFKSPDFGFTPDGGFPIHNKEKGYLDAKLYFQNQNMNDTADIRILSLNSGDSENSIPSKAEAVLEIVNRKKHTLGYLAQHANKHIDIEKVGEAQYKVTANGKSSHSSLPENGINAIELLCDFLDHFTTASQRYTDMIHFVNSNFKGDFHGRNLGFYVENPYEQDEYMGFTTVVPTVVVDGGGTLELNLNIRMRFGHDLEFIETQLKKISSKYKFHFKLQGYLAPLFVDKNKNYLRVMASVYENIMQIKNEFLLANGTSYAKAMPNIVSWGPIFQGQDDYCHQENEQIDIDLYKKAIYIYASFLYEILEETGDA